MDDTLAMLVVARALVQSYPTWTDEHGTNVEQLAEIAVGALAEHGLLVTHDLTDEEADQPVSTGVTRGRVAPPTDDAIGAAISLP